VQEHPTSHRYLGGSVGCFLLCRVHGRMFNVLFKILQCVLGLYLFIILQCVLEWQREFQGKPTAPKSRKVSTRVKRLFKLSKDRLKTAKIAINGIKAYIQGIYYKYNTQRCRQGARERAGPGPRNITKRTK
jgi:hypothetical protein